ncbi:hypothetical protein MHM98_16150 [Psychrobium sp. MM17-31]|uniref:hypothetical protein n=1 Tax=Psychrobium sp. MM17-31 TaxID=2917758 RepID=UPI001EF3E5AE|nr:hypothetical protein [Psychrobium sp. MM17-31]MCG7532864.1 hypothetical protein [Psychrobium sp. MM17-31]
MFDLFKSEFKRFRLVALIAFLVLMSGWIFYGKMLSILNPIEINHFILMLSALGGGIGVGAVQMWLHTRKNHWTYLVHRPMPMAKIHLALSAAAIAIITLGFILPFFMVVTYLDLMTNNAVDLRHYLTSLNMLFIAISAYFITSYVMLSASKLTVISLWMVTYIISRQNVEASVVIFIALIFAVLSFYMAHNAFKIDRTQLSTKKPMIVLASISMQPLLFVLLIMAQAVYYHLPLAITKSHPSKDLSRDTHFAFERIESLQQFEKIIANSDSPIAQSLARQLPLAQFEYTWLLTKDQTVKGQIFNADRSYSMWTSEMDSWVFSHDEMVFKGRNFLNDKLVGYLTNQGFVDSLDKVTPQSRFEFVPNIINDQLIYTQNKLFKVDFELQTITKLFQTSADEKLLGKPVNVFDLSILRTNKALLLFDKTDAMTADKLIAPLHRVEYPIAPENRVTVKISQMTDGYLVMFTSDHFYGFERGGSELIYVEHEGQISSIAKIDFDQYHFPRLLTEQFFTLSPVVANVIDFTLGRLLTTPKTAPESMKYFWQRDYPSSIWLFCLGIAVFSALVTFAAVRNLPMSGSNRLLWIALSTIGGLPALIAFFVLNDWREALRALRGKNNKQELSHV